MVVRVKAKARIVNQKDVPDDFYPDYVFDYMIKDSSLSIIEIKFENGFKFYFGTCQYINYKSISDVLQYFVEEYHLANLDYCSRLVNGAMNPEELQEYLSRDEDNMVVEYQKCEKLWGFYRKYNEEIKYVINLF